MAHDDTAWPPATVASKSLTVSTGTPGINDALVVVVAPAVVAAVEEEKGV